MPEKTWSVACSNACRATASGWADGVFDPIVALAMAPKIATPTALPVERQNRFVAVTTPRSLQPTLDWAAIRVGTATSPMPRPMRKQVPATCTTPDEPLSRVSNRQPQIAIEAPISAQ